MNTYYALQLAEKEADIRIFGDIVTEEWLEGDVSAHGLAQKIEQLKDVDRINVHIDSYGGAISEGWAIYNALRGHPAKIVTYGDGFVASAALFPFLAGDERRASSVSAYFLHQGMMGAYGNAGDLRAAADEIELLTKIGQQAFVERAGMALKQVDKLMRDETWLSPQQALELGIATSIIADPAPKHAQSVKRAIMQRVMGADCPVPSGPRAAQGPPPMEGPPPAPTPEPQPPEPQPGPSLMQMLAGFFDAKNQQNRKEK